MSVFNSIKSHILSVDLLSSVPMFQLFRAIKKGDVERFETLLDRYVNIFHAQPQATDVLVAHLYRHAYGRVLPKDIPVVTPNDSCQKMVEVLSRVGLSASNYTNLLQLVALASSRENDFLIHMLNQASVSITKSQAHLLAQLTSSQLCLSSLDGVSNPLSVDIALSLIKKFDLDVTVFKDHGGHKALGDVTSQMVEGKSLWDNLLSNTPSHDFFKLIDVIDRLPAQHNIRIHASLLSRCISDQTFVPDVNVLLHLHRSGVDLACLIDKVLSPLHHYASHPRPFSPEVTCEILRSFSMDKLASSYQQVIMMEQSRAQYDEMHDEIDRQNNDQHNQMVLRKKFKM